MAALGKRLKFLRFPSAGIPIFLSSVDGLLRCFAKIGRAISRCTTAIAARFRISFLTRVSLTRRVLTSARYRQSQRKDSPQITRGHDRQVGGGEALLALDCPLHCPNAQRTHVADRTVESAIAIFPRFHSVMSFRSDK